MYVLDTSTLSHFLLGKPTVVERIIELPAREVCITPITIGEGYFGLINAHQRLSEQKKGEIMHSLQLFRSLDITGPVGITYAELKVDLYRRSRWAAGIDNDLWIAAFCEHHGATLLTTDKDFHRLENLHITIEYITV